MKPVHSFTVIPRLPPRLESLRALAYNLRWAWDHETIALFRRLDDRLWESTGHNPALLLGRVDQSRLDAVAADEGFLDHLDRVHTSLEAYLADATTWHDRTFRERQLVAYFSAEFGVTECLSVFAGGLGGLAGDHLKSASDLGIPLVGVGLLYQQGYFRQRLNAAGWQQESYEDNDFHTLPLTLEAAPDGRVLVVDVPLENRQIRARVWRAQVGRVPLYLLDTNIPGNEQRDRDITDQLYGGDLDMRIRRETVLGIGGYRALEALGIEPAVCHMNEGHSAFLALERVRRLMEAYNLSFDEARAGAGGGLIFTTHTPVPAGHDRFPPELVLRYLSSYARTMRLGAEELLRWGREDPMDGSAPFNMTVLALRLASRSNGVSRLHGAVSRRMWQVLWPGLPAPEIPIAHVTNGVHFRSWISHEMNQVYDRYLGPRWREEPADETIWARAADIPALELWRTHERRRERLIVHARRRLREQLERRDAPPSEVHAAAEALDPEALTIGFGRRFATYKRATLLLRDPARLARIVNDPARPVQFVFAGKAHPRDEAGKELIRQVVGAAGQLPLRGRIIFLEDFDLALARTMVQGVDVWLNTPRRPLEACGTSGMKAAANGALNMSTLDGWWDEAWRDSDPAAGPVGWAIGQGESRADPDEQDGADALALYELLEHDVAPTFYDRDPDGLPRRWLARMKASISQLCHRYNTHRMVREYVEGYYLPAAARQTRRLADRAAGARQFAAWLERMREAWPAVRIESVEDRLPESVEVGQEVTMSARIDLNGLAPEDVAVQLLIGRIDANGEIVEPRVVPMIPAQGVGPAVEFQVRSVPCPDSGLHGYTIRVLPRHPDLEPDVIPGLIEWAGPQSASGLFES